MVGSVSRLGVKFLFGESMVKIVGEEWVRWAWGDLDHKTLFLL
jgi:hypothetical protein